MNMHKQIAMHHNHTIMKHARILSFFAIMCAFTITYQLGSMTDVSEEEAELFMSEFEKLVEGIDAVGIFTHNTFIALPMFLPGFGMVWGLVSSWSTGFAFAAITSTMPELASIHPLSILFLSPFGLMELSAYSIAMSRSLLMALTIIRRDPISEHLRPVMLEVGIVVALLLAGGYIEFFMIEQAQELSGVDAGLGP